jgi:hypothetical protein
MTIARISSIAILLFLASTAQAEEWIQLFNGRDLTGWTPKITNHPLGENYANTFRVENGVLKVSYDGYKTFDGQFGHLFYKVPFSHYRLIVEYRFVGQQAPGAPGDWANRNSGVMFHSQDPKTMTLDQKFPTSIEAQLLGGLSDGKARSTMNMCSPGTQIVFKGALYTEHCLYSSSKTFDGDQWVRAELLVSGSGKVVHSVNGEKVLEYTKPQLDDGTLLESGYIALQSESYPIEFRKVELLNLAGKAGH